MFLPLISAFQKCPRQLGIYQYSLLCLEHKQSRKRFYPKPETPNFEFLIEKFLVKPLKAEIEGFRSAKCSDSDEVLQFPGFRTHKRIEPELNHHKDQITRAVEVYPEGIEEEFIHSVYFCPKERIHISTPARYSPKYVEKPEKMNWFSFSVKARSEVHIILTKNHNGNHMYEIVLQKGAGQSFISKNKDQLHLVTTTAPDILSPDEFRQFWISWEDGNIQGISFHTAIELIEKPSSIVGYCVNVPLAMI